MRAYFCEQIQANALAWAVGRAEVEEIDHLNIFHASLLAMQRAVEKLSIQPEQVLVDGKHCPPNIKCPVEAIIKGDSKVPAISAASIIAKVTRDREMIAMDLLYPGYGLAGHKGYPTVMHQDALRRLGVTPIHRRSFKPVRDLL